MAKGLLLAWSSPASDESDAEFNSWYEDTHIPQVRAAIPSITAVYRYRTADLPARSSPHIATSPSMRWTPPTCRPPRPRWARPPGRAAST